MTDIELTNLLQSQIMAIIGRPTHFAMTKITKVSNSSYRVNLYCASKVGVVNQMDICESFFVTLDEDHNIIESTPPLKKRLTPNMNPQK